MQQEVFERQWRIRDGEVWICAFPMISEKSVVSEERLASGKHESKEGNETVTQTHVMQQEYSNICLYA
jgi:hypothetical protein